MMPDDEKTIVIARRTKKNLDFMYEQKQKGADVEEFTQLLNSMMGMLICLREEYLFGQEVRWDEVEHFGFERIEIKDKPKSDKQPKLEQVKSFSKLIGKLRNAFAHNNFELVGGTIRTNNPEIVGLKVWNLPPKTPQNQKHEIGLRTWDAELSEDELKKIAYLFIDYLEETRGNDVSTVK